MPPFPELWATLSGADRLLAVRTFAVRRVPLALRWRAFARDVGLAQRVIGPAPASDRLRYARWLVETGRIGEG